MSGMLLLHQWKQLSY